MNTVRDGRAISESVNSLLIALIAGFMSGIQIGSEVGTKIQLLDVGAG